MGYNPVGDPTVGYIPIGGPIVGYNPVGDSIVGNPPVGYPIVGYGYPKLPADAPADANPGPLFVPVHA